MTKTRYRVRREAMEWRRNKVEGLLIKGYTQNRIAQELQIAESTICLDRKNLRGLIPSIIILMDDFVRKRDYFG